MAVTVKVRVAVAVNAKGEWCVSGADCEDEAKSVERASSGWGPNIVHWVEADIPVPEVATVQGRVSARRDPEPTP